MAHRVSCYGRHQQAPFFTKLTALVTWIGEPTAGVTVRTMLIGRVTFTGIPQLVSAGSDRGLVVSGRPLLEPNLHSKLLMIVDGGVTEAVNVQRRWLVPPSFFTLQSAVLASRARYREVCRGTGGRSSSTMLSTLSMLSTSCLPSSSPAPSSWWSSPARSFVVVVVPGAVVLVVVVAPAVVVV